MENPAVPLDGSLLRDTIDHINRRVLATRLPCHTRSFTKAGSTIVAVHFSRPEHDYFIKVKRPQPSYGSTTESTRRSLRREYLTLQVLNQVPHQTFILPRPLLYDEERLVLATSAVPGTPFLQKYRLAARTGLVRRREMGADLRALGTALSEFHGLERRFAGDAEGLISREGSTLTVEGVVRKLDHDALRTRPRLRTAVRAWLKGGVAFDQDGPPERRPTLTHNDLGLHNVLCGDRPGLLDLDSVSISEPEVDVAYLLLSLVDVTLVAPTPGWRRARLGGLAASLLEGYGGGILADRLEPHLVNVGLQWIIDLDVRRRGARSLARRVYDGRLLARQARVLAGVLSPTCPGWLPDSALAD